ncbi:MAG: DUF547 domain-containing protein, partial [Spirochaetes bacterium]|nr:DUF547 domain-containing protein [Spirochaetota bacterium]
MIKTKATKNISNLSQLGRYLDENHNVDYERIKNDTWFLDKIKEFETMDLSALSHDDEFAFWLNAYNLFTIKAVLKVLEKKNQWKGNLTTISRFKFFVLRKHKIAGKLMSLSSLESKIIRRKFKDPRIHFAINCGSASCPVLYDRLFHGNTLNEILENVSTNFVNNSTQVNFDESSKILNLNPIFKWFKKDFKNWAGGVVPFIKRYWNGQIEKLDHAKIKY